MQDDLLVTARWLVPVTSPPVEHGAVLVRGGRIAAHGSEDVLSREATESRRLDLGCAALLPGLVNVHAHLELTALRGFLEKGPFFAWIRRLTEAKYERLAPEDLRLSSCWGVTELLRAGTATVGEVCDLGVSLEALVQGGLRGVLYQEVFGPDSSDAERRTEELKEKLKARNEASGSRLRVGVSPHAPYTVSPALFQRVTELALEGGYPLSTHTAESAAERALLLRGEGPFAEHLRRRGIAWSPPRCSTIRYLNDLGLLRSRPLLVHCVDSRAADFELAASSGAAIAHCPRSNAKLGHGVADLMGMLSAGLTVGLGSDGVVSSNTVDLFEEARTAILFQRARRHDDVAGTPTAPDAREALRMLTIGGARALGLEEETGSIDVGKCADLTAVSLSAPHMQPIHEIESTIVWSASARDVVLTMVEGEVLYERGRVLRLDEELLRREIQAIPGKLARRPPG